MAESNKEKHEEGPVDVKTNREMILVVKQSIRFEKRWAWGRMGLHVKIKTIVMYPMSGIQRVD